jgi:hypothetical protein
VLWYAVNKHHLVRLVTVRDPAGLEPDDFFVTTDLSATGAETASLDAGRWSVEVCFRDVKQDLGGEQPQSWKRRGPERAAVLALWLHTVIWCWYLETHPAGHTWIRRPIDAAEHEPGDKLKRHVRPCRFAGSSKRGDVYKYDSCCDVEDAVAVCIQGGVRPGRPRRGSVLLAAGPGIDSTTSWPLQSQARNASVPAGFRTARVVVAAGTVTCA